MTHHSDGHIPVSLTCYVIGLVFVNLHVWSVLPQYENPWTIPNLLCMCRIVLAPFLGHLVIQQQFDLSLALFFLAGATDLVNVHLQIKYCNCHIGMLLMTNVYVSLFRPRCLSWMVSLPERGPVRSRRWEVPLTHWLIRFLSAFYTSVSPMLNLYRVYNWSDVIFLC